MGRVKEALLNHLSRDYQDEVTGYVAKDMDMVYNNEMDLLSRIISELKLAHDRHEIDQEYVDYLSVHPVEAVDWLRDYMGVNII